MDKIAEALRPYGFDWLVSATGIPGTGSMIVVFAGPGDFYTACLTHDNQVVWVMTCGGQEVEANTDKVNALHAATRKIYELSPRTNQFQAPDTGHSEGQSIATKPEPGSAAVPPIRDDWEPWPNSYNPNNTTQMR